MKGQKIIFPAIASVVFVSLIFVLNFSSIYAEDSIIDVQLTEPETTPFGSNVQVLLSDESTPGKGQRSDVNDFLRYAGTTTTFKNIPFGTTSFDITIFYGPTVDASTFSSTLNRGSGTQPSFSPSAGTSETVTIDLGPGRNTLVLSIEGQINVGTPAEKTSKDTDRVVFVVNKS